jgi:hypothetical protein
MKDNKNFFEISTPRDMFNKARRELKRMKADYNTDTIFNFFVTAYHIMDYVKKQEAISPAVIKDMYDDSDFQMCHFICNKGKHLILKKGDKDTKTIYKPGAIYGEPLFGSTMYNESPSYKFFVDDQEINIIELAKKLIKKWESFLSKNKL